MDIDEAMRRSVKSFYEGSTFESYEKATGKKVKHSKEFFDNYEKELRKGGKTKPKKEDNEIDEVEEDDLDA